jgi:hypothetical protein
LGLQFLVTNHLYYLFPAALLHASSKSPDLVTAAANALAVAAAHPARRRVTCFDISATPTHESGPLFPPHTPLSATTLRDRAHVPQLPLSASATPARPTTGGTLTVAQTGGGSDGRPSLSSRRSFEPPPGRPPLFLPQYGAASLSLMDC